jgi:acetolactate decarboxylase
MYQVSTLGALLEGVYDGEWTVRDLKKRGDFGLGTFDALDGEMVIMSGIVYQVRSDGSVRVAGDEMRSPFAVVTYFHPDRALPLEGQPDLQGIETILDRAIRSRNLPYAIKIDGIFLRVRARSVPAQKKPYPRLVEVTKNQPEFEYRAVRGTMIGFRLPPYTGGINLAGYHFHFLTEDRTAGGHVLECRLESGKAEIAGLDRLELHLPRGGAFLDAPLHGADQAEAKSVESATGKNTRAGGSQ